MTFQEYLKTLNIDNPEIISIKKGDVNGDLTSDTVFLIGTKELNSFLIKNITIIINDGKTNDFYQINPVNNMGYNPSIDLINFSKNNYESIMLSIDSGGSGGLGYYYIYNFVRNNPNLLFDSDEFNNRYKYEVTYQDHYKVLIKNQTLRNQFIIDISLRPKEYLNEIYNSDGTLKNTITGFVSGLNALFPVDFGRNQVYNLMGVQRVSGLYAADSLGLIETELSLVKGGFYPVENEQKLSIFSTKY